MFASVVHAQRQELAVGVQRQLRLGDVVAAMRVRHEALGALGRPLHRPAHLAGGPGDDRLLGVVEDLRAEAAADIGRHDAQLVLRRCAARRRPSAAGSHAGSGWWCTACSRRGAVEIADRRARLHRVRDQPVVHQVELRRPWPRWRRPRRPPPCRRYASRSRCCRRPRRAPAARRARSRLAAPPRPAARRSRCRSPRRHPCACFVSAITTATASPTWRTLPTASTGCGGSAIGEPSLLWICQPQGRPPSCRPHVRAGEDRHHAGLAFAAAVSMPVILRMRVRADGG